MTPTPPTTRDLGRRSGITEVGTRQRCGMRVGRRSTPIRILHSCCLRRIEGIQELDAVWSIERYEKSHGAGSSLAVSSQQPATTKMGSLLGSGLDRTQYRTGGLHHGCRRPVARRNVRHRHHLRQGQTTSGRRGLQLRRWHVPRPRLRRPRSTERRRLRIRSTRVRHPATAGKRRRIERSLHRVCCRTSLL